jgi:hypothetical protein
MKDQHNLVFSSRQAQFASSGFGLNKGKLLPALGNTGQGS